MLEGIEKGYFSPISINRKTQKFVTKLREQQYLITGDKQIPEFIPYEELWELFLSNIKAPKRHVKYA